MCTADPDYRGLCRTLLGALTYEARLIVMDHSPVTRVMTKAQGSDYLEAIQADFQKHGVMLEFPTPTITTTKRAVA